MTKVTRAFSEEIFRSRRCSSILDRVERGIGLIESRPEASQGFRFPTFVSATHYNYVLRIHSGARLWQLSTKWSSSLGSELRSANSKGVFPISVRLNWAR